ncbi:hypothetical protein DY000_02032894 [Brassica cretica]|uniref:Uncharacterized protein n=1 Tax=Brassica cretica TaxID=69181 RepID=A0ABQ7DEY4_BRACR|nr:hypothetical protein DY000_02032894 [Brassica cretica]
MESSAKSADHESLPQTTFRDPISQKLFRNSAQAGSEINSSASFFTAIFLVCGVHGHRNLYKPDRPVHSSFAVSPTLRLISFAR